MDSVNKIARFRTIKQCMEAIGASDPDSAVTEWYIRQLARSGKIICYGSGNKSLVNLDSLLEYLNRSLDEINNEKPNKE